MKKTLALIGLLASAGTVHAADLYDAPPPAPIAPASLPVWTGFYFGAHAGYGWGEWDGQLTYDEGHGRVENVFADSNSLEGDGFIGGVQAGYNHQIGSLVLGVEADVSWSGIDGEDTFATKAGTVEWNITNELDAFGTVRGRLGYALDNLLIYGTGGLALGRTSSDLVVTETPGVVTARGSSSDNHVGWTVGAGAEWMLSPNWSVKAEYQFVDLGEADYHLTGKDITGKAHVTDSFPADLQFHTVRAGVNYRLGQ